MVKALLKDTMPLHFLLLAKRPAHPLPRHAHPQRSALIVHQPMAAPLSSPSLKCMTIRPTPTAVLVRPVMDIRHMETTVTPLLPTSLHTISNSTHTSVILEATTLHMIIQVRWASHGHSRCRNGGLSNRALKDSLPSFRVTTTRISPSASSLSAATVLILIFSHCIS